MKQILFNPFRTIGGTKALWIGWVIMLITAGVSIYSRCHFDGALDVHVGQNTTEIVYFLEPLINWSVLTLIFYITGLLLSTSAIRWIDYAGTVALARYPYLLAALIAFALPTIDPESLMNIPDMDASTLVSLMITSILILLVSIWMIMLLYRAFTISGNLRGRRAVWGFIIALLISEIITVIIFHYLYKNLIR